VGGFPKVKDAKVHLGGARKAQTPYMLEIPDIPKSNSKSDIPKRNSKILAKMTWLAKF
jgi:hypothetical protein